MGYENKYPTKDLTRQDWLELRCSLGIGGSEVSTIFGINRFQSPIELWQEKTGKKPIEETDSEAAYWGTQLEDIVAQEYSKRTGDKVQKCNFLFKRGAQTANIDRFVLNGTSMPLVNGEFRGKKLLECKTASIYTKDQWGAEGTDAIPLYYLLQVQQYMDLLDAKECDVAVLIAGVDFRIYTVKYDAEIAAKISQKVNDFWNYFVMGDESPQPINMEEVKQFYAQTRRESIIANSEALFDYESLVEVRNKLKDLEEKETSLKDKIALYLQDKEDLIDMQGNTLVTWRAGNGRSSTKWENVLSELGLTKESPEVQKHTTVTPVRTFLVKNKK